MSQRSRSDFIESRVVEADDRSSINATVSTVRDYQSFARNSFPLAIIKHLTFNESVWLPKHILKSLTCGFARWKVGMFEDEMNAVA
jgi:hypothetical protein